MLNKLKYVLILIAIVWITACTPKNSEFIVAEFGNQEISLKDFENAYVKNVGSLKEAKKDSLKELEEFLDLYVNYRMKLRDAEVRNLPNDEKVKSEIEEYKKSIGVSYLLEKELIDKGIRDLYEKRKYELRISHILLRQDSLSDKELEEKAYKIIDEIKNGLSFEVAAAKYSQDRFSSNKGGDIYYITAGMVIPEFEDLAYETPVGEVNPKPVKTKYGYHIIKVTDKRERIPSINASHILIRKDIPTKDRNGKNPKELIAKILLRARDGEDFSKLAKEYSEDPGSKDKGGNLGYFSRRQMVQPFDETAFNLKVGEISDIVETQFGYHIIKLNKVSKYGTFDQEKKSLRDLYVKTRKQRDYDLLLSKYKNELKFEENELTLKNLITEFGDLTFDKDYWKSDLHNKIGKDELFKVNNISFNVDSLVSYAEKSPQNSGNPATKEKLLELKKNFEEQKILESKAEQALSNDSTFISLMDEYRNGILIFRLQEDEVWSNMEIDSVDLLNFYEKNKENYTFPNRVKYDEIFSKSDSVINLVYKKLKEGEPFDSLMVKYSSKKVKLVSPEKHQFYNESKNILSQKAYALEKTGDFSEVFNSGRGYSIVKLVEKEPSRIKTFEEAKAEITSAYQDVLSARLENEYVLRLRNLYKPEIYYEELKNAFKN